jgi:phosphonate transport system substrate-binding protein
VILLRFVIAFVLATVTSACTQREESAYRPEFGPQATVTSREYLFGVHPLHNPKHLFEVFGPLVDYLNAHMPGSTFRLEASRNYAEFDKKLYGRHFQFALPNPYQTVNCLKHGYRVFGKMADDQNFRGIILVRKDSGINEIADLKGKAVSYPAPTALAATLMPQYYLHTHGLDANKDIETLYVGSQESSIMNVYLGKSAAGATWPPPWMAFAREHPEQASQLKVQWQTEPLVNNGLVVRDDVPADVAARVAELLLSLHTDNEGRVMLERMPLSRFEPADDNTYEPVRRFLRTFAATVRPLED